MRLSLTKSWTVFLTVLALTFSSLGVKPAYADYATFTNKTIANGLGSNIVYGVFGSGGTVYAATVGGLSISTNSGATFVNKTIANGLGDNVVFGVYASGATVYAATQNGLSISTDGGGSFTNRTSVNSGLAGNNLDGVYAIGSTVYAASGGGLSISIDGGSSFTTRTTANGLGDDRVMGVWAVGSMVYAATVGGLAISTNGGASFTNKTTANGLGDNHVYGVFTNGSTIYAATAGGLSISTNGGATFVNKTIANGLGDNLVNGVYASGATVYAATQGGLSIGKNTLTFESVWVNDGWILESAENSNIGGTFDVNAATFQLGDDAAKKQYRGILSFSTAPLPDTAVITNVTLKIKRQGVTGAATLAMFQGLMVDVKKGYFGTLAALQAADFQAATGVAGKTYGPFSPALVSGWYNVDLTAGQVYINKAATRSGLTQIRLRFKLDDNNNAVANYMSFYSGNAVTAANRPQLIIQYYMP